jgi:AbrB family looped-hinge helix DNA binding protein
MSTSVTRKGQVTIPKRVRDRLAIVTGSAVEFELRSDGRVTMTKIGGRKPRNRFEPLRGRAGKGPSTEEIMALTRGEA